MCALTIAPPSTSPDPRNDPSWVSRAAKVRVKRPPATRSVSLSFRDLRVSASDVTTIGDAFARCSVDDLLAAVLRHEAGWRIPMDTIGSRAHHMLMGKIASALEAMRSLEDSVAALSPSREGIVGPLFRFASIDGGMALEHRVEAVVFSESDGAAIGKRLASGLERACTWDALRTLHYEDEASADLDRLAPKALHASHSILGHMPWERVLALPLWLPEDLSEDERQAILAKVFWSMTYRGFTQSGVSHDMMVEQLQGAAYQRQQPDSASWPADPVLAVLDHNCWVDTLEAWNALFEIMRSGETRP